ncbi:MAG TPA: hypothetical protein VGF67_08735 [Ktedonobacteraceae bacterium]
MLCPSCRAGCAAEDTCCRRCGADLGVSSRSLVAVPSRLPMVLQRPQLPRLAAGVGALAVGVGLELLRRNVLARFNRRTSARFVPSLASTAVRELFARPQERSVKLPRGYEVRETTVYMTRVIRREH